MTEGWRKLFGERLRELRQERSLTQEKLAELSEVHPGYVQKLEAGERLPSLPTLIRLCRALDVPVAAMLPPVDVPAERQDVAAVAALLSQCSPEQVALIREIVLILQRSKYGQ